MQKNNANPRFFPILDDFLSPKYVSFLDSLDRQVTINLIECEIETRPVKDNGLWCVTLIPAVLLFNTVLYDVSPVYSLITYVSLGLLFYCCLFIVFMSVSCLVLNEPIYGGCVASCLVSTMMIYSFLNQDLTYSFVLSAIAIYGHTIAVRNCITAFPKTFTVGEAMMVSQAIVLYVTMTVVKLNDTNANDEDDLITAVVNTVLVTVALIAAVMHFMTERQRADLTNFFLILGGGAVFAIIMLQFLLGFKSVVLVLDYVFFDVQRLQLFMFWLSLVGLAICVLLMRTRLAVKASTVARKTFHVFGAIVFLSGILLDVHLITLAAGVGLGMIIFAEALRLANIEPMSSALQSAFLVYSDEKDCGTFAMTPLYLYCGLACPLLLVPSWTMQLELLSGVLSIGIGDTAASWFGSRYGFNKWPNSSKSLEGTTFNILSQVLAVYALEVFHLIDSKNALFRTAVAGTLSALVEAKTEQVDNLLLPLVTLLGFQLTCIVGSK